MTNVEIHQTDWVGSNLVFYNVKTGVHNENINSVISLEDSEIDPAGFYNFTKYGYSVFGDTPIKNVKFTLPNTKLVIGSDRKLHLQQLPDPILEILGNRTTEISTIDQIEAWMSDYYRRNTQVDEPVILPLSGGLDSRMLAYMSRSQKNVHTFTYGISKNQKKSHEVILGKEVAKQTNLPWQQVTLGRFHEYLELNNQIYGPSTHSHSMYHFEFFSTIRRLLNLSRGGKVLSGIYGDLWAGSWDFSPVGDVKDLKSLAITHGMEMTRSTNRAQAQFTEKEIEYFEYYREPLKDPLFRVVTAARLKMILIRQLIQTPKALGFDASSPFLDFNIAASMLTLDPTRRANRIWQREYLDKHLSLAQSRFKNRVNVSDLYGTLTVPLPQVLNKSSTPQVIQALDIEKISSRVEVNFSRFLMEIFVQLPIIAPVLSKLGIKRKEFSADYANYMIMYPIISIFGFVKKTDRQHPKREGHDY